MRVKPKIEESSLFHCMTLCDPGSLLQHFYMFSEKTWIAMNTTNCLAHSPRRSSFYVYSYKMNNVLWSCVLSAPNQTKTKNNPTKQPSIQRFNRPTFKQTNKQKSHRLSFFLLFFTYFSFFQFLEELKRFDISTLPHHYYHQNHDRIR